MLQRSVTNLSGLAIRHRPEPFVPALPALEAAHVLRAPGLQEQGTLPLPRPIVVIACMACLDPEEVVCQLEIHTLVYALPDKPVDNAMSTYVIRWLGTCRGPDLGRTPVPTTYLHSKTVVPPLPGQGFFSACGPSAGALMWPRFWQHEALDYVRGVDEGCNGGLKEREDGCGRMRGGRGQWEG